MNPSAIKDAADKIGTTLSPTDDAMAIAVRAWRRLDPADRAALAGALGIVETPAESGARPPIIVYRDGAKVVAVTPWKPAPGDFGDRESPTTFRGACSVGGARWDSGRWTGGARFPSALGMLRGAGWTIRVVADAAAADAAVAEARAALPIVLSIRRAKVAPSLDGLDTPTTGPAADPLAAAMAALDPTPTGG